MGDPVPLIEARDLHKSFVSVERSIDVLRGVDLRVDEGEMVAIVGASGTGKSTLLHVLGTLDRPSRGELRFDGVDVLALSEEQTTAMRNHKMGFVFQFHHLLPEFTAVENVAMPLWIARTPPTESSARAAELLARLGLSDRLEHRPAQMSGGEQQRVAIARALVCEPRLLLADEPTGNLDSQKSRELVGLMRELHDSHDLTSVVVTHSEEIASVCDRVLRMDDGRLS